MDPRSTAESGYEVILGTIQGRQGLYATTFLPDGAGNLTDGIWRRILWKSGLFGFRYDQGWDTPTILARFYDFTPTAWGERRIWSTTGQSLFEGDPSADGWPTSEPSWSARYTENAGSAGGFDFYRTRGIESTVNYDQAALGSYVVQAQADNGLVESFDGGFSWTKQHQPSPPAGNPYSNARAVHVFDTVSPAVTLAAAGVGFGTGSGWTPLHALVSDAPSASTPWNVRIDASLNGPKNDYVASITPALMEPGSSAQGVYLAYQGALGADGGIWYHPDVAQLAQGQGLFTQIAGQDGSLKKTYKVAAHPTNPDRLYRLTNTDLVRMERDAQGVWQDTLISNGAKDFAVWAYEGLTYVIFGKQDQLLISDDEGDTFRSVWTVPPSAYGPWADWVYVQTGPDMRGFVGSGRDFFFGVSQYKNRKSMGYYRGTLQRSGPGAPLVVQDFTSTGEGRLTNARSSESAEILTIQGTDYVAVPTRGSGLWVREAPSGDAPIPLDTLVATLTDDTFVRGGATRDSLFGASSVLELSQGSGGDNKRNVYLRFDLSEAELPVTSATLRLYGSLTEAVAEGVETQVWTADEDEWNEETVTWGDNPGAGSRLTAFSLTETADSWHEIDVTAFVNGETDGVASFHLRIPGAFPGLAVFSSKEGSDAPELVLSTVIPEPVSTEEARAPDLFVVSPVFPNPSSGGAALALQLPHESAVRAVVYDALGREVALVPARRLSGAVRLRLDTGALAPGLYVVRVWAGDAVVTRRMTVAR